MSTIDPVSEVDIDKVLSTIREIESSGDYGAKAKTSSASGAYQFIDDTWQRFTKKYGVGTEYPTAREAPSDVQDQVARLKVQEILSQSGGDVNKVPLIWYTGNSEGRMTKAQLAANKGLSAERYQQKWLRAFNKREDQPVVQEPVAVDQGPRPASPRMARAAQARTQVAAMDMPANYKAALAASYLGDTEEGIVADKALEMLEELQSDSGGGAGAFQKKMMSILAPREQGSNAFALMQKGQEEEPKQERRRVVPRMPTAAPQMFANGGMVARAISANRPRLTKTDYDWLKGTQAEFESYNTEVDKYLAAIDAYNAKVDAYNAAQGVGVDDPGEFTTPDPTPPSRTVEEAEARQKEAQDRAKRFFMARNTAYENIMDPGKYNLSGMSFSFADGGSVSKSGVNRLKQARAVPAMPRFQDGGEVEQMTVGTLPQDQTPAGEALSNVRRDLVRGAQYLPYDLLGAPVDIINLGLTPFGLGSERPVGGAEWLIDKSARAGIADRPTDSAAELATRVGMGFVNPATVAKYAPRGIEALRRADEIVREQYATGRIPAPGMATKQSTVDTSVLLPKENKPFIGQVERMAADLPGPVTKEQFLNQVKKQGRNYEINRLEQALENLPGNAKLTPQEIIDRLAPTSPSRFTMEIVPPGTKHLYDTMDNPFPSIKPGAVNLLLDMPPEQKQMADMIEKSERLVDDLSRFNLLRPVTDTQRMPEIDFLRNPPISMVQKIEPMIPAIQELGDITGKDVTKIIRSMQSIAERGDDLNAINVQRAKLAYPALTAKWDTYANMPKEQLPAQLKDNWGYLDTDKLVASIYDDAIQGIRSSIKNASFFKADDFTDELQALDSLEAWNNQFKLGKATYSQTKAEAEAAERVLTSRLDMFTEPLKSQADRLGNNVDNLRKEIPMAYYEGTHRAIVTKNPISFSRFVEFTPNKADELGISMPDQDRGVMMYLELQSDRQKALRLAKDVEEAFPGMGQLPQVTQQLMLKNAIYGGIQMDKGLVLFPGSDSAQKQLYEKLGPNLKQVVKDLGPGFKASEFKFKNEKGEMATRWGVYIDQDAAQRVKTQGMRFAKGGMVDKPLYDRAA